MSKASEWVREGRPVKGRPVWTHGATYRAAAVVAGRYHSLNGVAIAKRGHRRVRMDTEIALSLARWILDTFSDGPASAATPGEGA